VPVYIGYLTNCKLGMIACALTASPLSTSSQVTSGWPARAKVRDPGTHLVRLAPDVRSAQNQLSDACIGRYSIPASVTVTPR